jgi:hypothetical protein
MKQEHCNSQYELFQMEGLTSAQIKNILSNVVVYCSKEQLAFYIKSIR